MVLDNAKFRHSILLKEFFERIPIELQFYKRANIDYIKQDGELLAV